LQERMGRLRESLVWEGKARELYRIIQTLDPDSLESATNDASSLLHLGELEAKAGMRVQAGKDIAAARSMLERQKELSPKSRIISDLLDRAAASERAQ